MMYLAGFRKNIMMNYSTFLGIQESQDIMLLISIYKLYFENSYINDGCGSGKETMSVEFRVKMHSIEVDSIFFKGL